MAVLFIVARLLEARYAAIGFVRAFAEAALVGGLADWFAVTALFRHPLGVPIPHTAIIPTHKDRLADSVAAFLQQNFLTRAVLTAELSRLDFATLAADWLADEKRRRSLATAAAGNIAEHLVPGPLLGDWLLTQLAQQRHQQLFDRLILWGQQMLERHHADIYQKVSEKSPRWMPRRINDEFYLRLMDGFTELLDGMLAPDSDARAQFGQLLHEQAQRLVDGDWDEAIAKQLHAAVHDGSLASHIDAGLAGLAERLASDPDWRERLNRRLRRRAVAMLVRQRERIVGLVRRVIRDWDAQTVSTRVESYVGRDLQFIRINGTLVGGVVGIAIHAVASLM